MMFLSPFKFLTIFYALAKWINTKPNPFTINEIKKTT